MAKTLGPLSRPQIVRTDYTAFDRDLRREAGEKIAFDVILGRNILTREKKRALLVERAARLLRSDGRMALAEVVPSEGQRISALTGEWPLAPELKKILREAEDSLFGDPDDPMVAWNTATLEKELSVIPGLAVAVAAQTDTSPRRISPAEIDFWLRTTDKKARPPARLSLGDRIAERSDEGRLSTIRAFLHRKLDNQEVFWKSVTAFINISV
jgi:hypothetical protein